MTPDLTRRELIRAGGAGAAGIALLGASACDSGGDAGATEQTRTPAPPPANPMNVVVVVMDSLRADHIYGSRARTASMEKVMQEGVRFVNAYPEGMPTIPARRAIMAGRRTFPFRGWKPKWDDLPAQPGWEPVGSDGEMWTEVLARNGWTTGYVTDNPHMLLPVHKNFRSRFDRAVLVDGQVPVRRKPKRRVPEKQVDHFMPASIDDGKSEPRMATYLSINPRHRAEEDFNSAKVFTQGMNWLEWARNRQPFALVVDTFEPHEPWTPPRRYIDMYGDPDYRGPEPARPYYAPVSRYLSGSELVLVDRMKALYAAEVTMTDRWLGVFLDKLDALRLERDTILVFVSDHGIYLGDHGMTGKSSITLHPELIRVPLIVVDPRGRHAGRTSSWFASTHDIAPTVLSMTGLPVPRRMDGVDLSPLLDGNKPGRERRWHTASYNDHVAASDGRWLLIADNQGRRKRLYAMSNESVNVASSHPNVVNRLWGYVKRDAGPKGLPDFS